MLETKIYRTGKDNLKRGSTVDYAMGGRNTKNNTNLTMNIDQNAMMDSILQEGVDTKTMNSSIMRSPQSTRGASRHANAT